MLTPLIIYLVNLLVRILAWVLSKILFVRRKDNYLEYPVNISKLKNQGTEYFQSPNSTPFPFEKFSMFNANKQ